MKKTKSPRKFEYVLPAMLLCLLILLSLTSCNTPLDFEELSLLEGVSMTTEKITYPTNVEKINVTWNNNTEVSLTFGAPFYIVRKTNNGWEKVATKLNTAFNDIAYILSPGGKANHTYYLTDIYNRLKGGTYRIVTEFYASTDSTQNTPIKYSLFAEIELSKNAEANLAYERKGHFFRTDFGGALVNFPNENYVLNHQEGKYDSNIIVIQNTSTIQEMFSNTYSQKLSEDESKWIRSEEFSDLMETYDEAFFKTQQLVTFIVSAAGGGYSFSLSEVKYSDKTLTVELEHTASGYGTAALVSWFAIIEAEKIGLDTEIEIEIIDRGW